MKYMQREGEGEDENDVDSVSKSVMTSESRLEEVKRRKARREAIRKKRETLFDPEVYEMLEPAAEPVKPKVRKPKAAPVVEPEAPADDDDFDLGDLDA